MKGWCDLAHIPVDMSSQGLQRLLCSFGIDTTSWGCGDARTIDQLFNEISLGESFLRVSDSGRLERVLRVIKMIIEDPRRGILLEDYRILPDGKRREVQRSPSGKMASHESPVEALIREMNEELSLGEKDFRLGFIESVRVEEKPSKAYPNLSSIYELYPAHLTLAPHVNLEDGYSTIDKEDGKKIFFRWKNLPTQS